MLPTYLIIGAQRSGSSTLYSYLNQHPAVAPSLIPEVHYFDLNFQRGTEWYRAHFPTLNRAQKFRREFGTDLQTGEVSAYYIFHPLVSDRVKVTLPNVRLIVVLRDPVERAWAQYLQNRARNLENLTFKDAIEREEERLANERQRLVDDETATSFEYRVHSYINRGIYIAQIRHWIETFGREQLYFVRGETLLFEDPASVIEGVQDFLRLSRSKPKRIRIYSREAEGLLDRATRDCLKERFRPYNQRLFEYLDWDFGWNS